MRKAYAILRLAAVVAPMAAGLLILHAYLSYLNRAPWLVFPKEAAAWHYIKPAIFLAWAAALWGGIAVIRRRLLRRGHRVTRAATLRAYLAAAAFCVSVVPHRPPNIDLTAYFFIHAAAYALILYAFFSIPWIDRCVAALGKQVLRLWRLPGSVWAAAAFCALFFMAYRLSWALFQHFPWIDDTIVQFVHAKFILQGGWYGQSHELPRFFDMTMMVNDGKWYSQYPPGHVLMLAAGLALNHPEMVNPFLGAGTCVAVYLLAKELYGAHVAKIAALLSALCAYLAVVSSEYMNHATSLLTGTLFFWAYFRMLRRPLAVHHAALAGAALGYCFITRPYTAFALALPAGLYAWRLTMSKPRAYAAPVTVMAAVLACFLAFQFYYNAVTTGDALTFGYQRLHGAKHNPFSPSATQKLTPERLEKNLRFNHQRLTYFNRMLFEWPLPALGLAALAFALRGGRRDERLLLATIVSMFISVQFTIHGDIGWGPRLVYEITGILLVLCAKALSLLPPLLRKLSARRRGLRFYYGAGALILASFYPVAASYNLKIPTIRGLYSLYGREGNPHYYNAIIRQVQPPALVFVPAENYKFVSFTNPPDADNPIIFARNSGSRWGNQPLMNHYPRRHVYVADGQSRVRKIR